MVQSVSLNLSQRPLVDSAYLRNALISLVVLFGAFILAYMPTAFDLPLTKLINNLSNRSASFDLIFYDLDTYASLSGAMMVALVWACWFGTRAESIKARLAIGFILSFPIGVVSRYMQHALPTHPRPIYDPALAFHTPSTATAALNTLNSFPSDHSTVYGALLIVIFIARPRLVWLAFPWFFFMELARVYMGAHYPSDMIGGASLAAAVIWTAQAPPVMSLGRRLVRWEQSSPALFYMLAFLLSYQIATLFGDVRAMVGGFKFFHLV